MKISTELTMTLAVVLVVFGYVQGVVVPQTEMRYAQQAALGSFNSPLGNINIKKAIRPCNPVVSKCGKLVIRKDTVPNNPQNFTFVHYAIPGYNPTFILDDDAGFFNSSLMPNTATFYTPYNGTFIVAEVVNASYDVTVVCSDPSGGTTIDGAVVSVSIYNGESVGCIFKNVPG